MCGIAGIVGTSGVNQRIYDALTVLQHRGQDAAGIATVAEGELFTAATALGMRPMREDGQRLLDEGITSLEEVLRVTPD